MVLGGGSAETGQLKQVLKGLGERRSRIEAEIESVAARLQAPGQPGLHGSLLDSEGFPRADIDIPKVRSDRHRLAVLHTDFKSVSKELEEALFALHAAARLSKEADTLPPADDQSQPATPGTLQQQQAAASNILTQKQPAASLSEGQPEEQPGLPQLPPAELVPFAVIDEVATGSPGDLDGFRLGDKLVSFGGVTADAGNPVAAVASELRSSEGSPLVVVALRAGQRVSFTVTPRSWPGRGLLG